MPLENPSVVAFAPLHRPLKVMSCSHASSATPLQPGIRRCARHFTPLNALGATLLLLVLTIVSAKTNAQSQTESVPKEHQIKAAFLYNFTRFVDWPPERFETDDSPIVIYILGRDPFGDDLRNSIAERTVDGRELRVESIRSVNEAADGHILFIAEGEEGLASRSALRELHQSSVLTIGESEVFRRRGGVITFTVIDGRVRFHINRNSAKLADLRISSQLLQLAVIDP